jgi:DNA-binding response OmpR family regulator
MNPVEPESHTATLLVVEDDPELQSYLVRILDRSGYACQTASTCAEAQAIFEEGAFAAALVDLGLPDGDGLDLMAELVQTDPCLVAIVLTGDASPDTVIGAMRRGAFDYLMKPVDLTTLRAAVSRALSHHAVVRERAELVRLLLEEREQLRARVEAATVDLRSSNERLHSLLELTRLSSHHLSTEDLVRKVFERLCRHIPVYAIALCDVTRSKAITLVRLEGQKEGAYAVTEGDGGHAGFDALLAEAEPELLVSQWVERATGIDAGQFGFEVFPQTLWNRSVSSVAFYMDAGHEVSTEEHEFLGMCAHFLAFEWEQANLLLQVAHQASLGNIALELIRNFGQNLTAIRTAADFVSEAAETPDIAEGMNVIQENVERLRMQTQEFRKLSSYREGSVETVHLDEYIEQALGILAVTIRSRGVQVNRTVDGSSQCVLLNGTAMARVILDILINAVRTVEVGARIDVTLRPHGNEYIAFEMQHDGLEASQLGKRGLALSTAHESDAHPGLQLAERTVHGCGGKLSLERTEDGQPVLRILLNRNATDPSVAREMVW